jgi:hypothetical protein
LAVLVGGGASCGIDEERRPNDEIYICIDAKTLSVSDKQFNRHDRKTVSQGHRAATVTA